MGPRRRAGSRAVPSVLCQAGVAQAAAEPERDTLRCIIFKQCVLPELVFENNSKIP